MNAMPENISVTIEDDFDLEKIAKSGQCFRMTAQDDGWYRVIASDKVLWIRQLGDGREFELRCDGSDWDGFWREYFDLDRTYARVREANLGKSQFVDEAMYFGEGLRVLNQDPWEMLITFIISQRKSMPAIATAVESLSRMFGSKLEEGAYAFPTPEQLASASEAELREASLGYRAPYVLEAARKVARGEADLEALAELDDDGLQAALMGFVGVGPKVANCVSLFGYGRSSSVPVDVWIARAIDQEFGGVSPFDRFGADAGIMQQFIFYYMTHRR